MYGFPVLQICELAFWSLIVIRLLATILQTLRPTSYHLRLTTNSTLAHHTFEHRGCMHYPLIFHRIQDMISDWQGIL